LEDFDDELRQIDMDQKDAILVVRAYKRYLAKTDEDREYGTEVIERISNSDTTREDADFIIRCTEVIDNLIDKVFEEKVANKKLTYYYRDNPPKNI
jgi:vacuolar-type H+-ATPase subunit E/Vma4